jgi:hypothetical protein
MAETLLFTGAAAAFLVLFAASLWLLFVFDPDNVSGWPWMLRTSALMALAGTVAFGLVWLILFVFSKGLDAVL